MKRFSVFLCLFAVVLFCDTAFSYAYNKSTDGPLTVEIEKPGVMSKLDEPLEIKTTLKNEGDTPLKLHLVFTTIETIEFDPPGKTKNSKSENVEIPAGESKTVSVNVVGRSGTLSMHYPVYLDAHGKSGGKDIGVFVVQPFESTITPNPNWPTSNPMLGKIVENAVDLPLNTVSDGAGLSLAALTTYRAFWSWDKEKNIPQRAGDEAGTPAQSPDSLHFEPIGWSGGNPESGASVHRQSMTRGGVTRQALNMHPTWRGGPGDVGVQYRIKLPETKPITFSCFGAMRDVLPPEPPTDGVTFQVSAVGPGKVLKSEKHIVETNWEPLELDLTFFAGKEILLQLHADPGPKRDTTCDSCFWGDPLIFAGEKPDYADSEAHAKRQAELHAECVEAMKTGEAPSGRTKVFELEGGMRGVVTFGNYAFVDGKIAIGSPEKFVVYDGVKVSVKGQPVAQWPTTLALKPCWSVEKPVYEKRSQGNAKPAKPVYETVKPIYETKSGRTNPKVSEQKFVRYHDVRLGDSEAKLIYTVESKGPALQFDVECSEKTWISSIRLGPASEVVEKVYYGHGYCVVKPQAFTVGADGHRLSTSHVGFEYPSGLSVLLATTTAPTELIVDPERKIATLDVRPGTTLSLLPGTEGMFDCAIRYRAINPKKAAPGVKTKAGRFCFDIWGGPYHDHIGIIENAIRYGLTDSLFIAHDWQRYGYDNRLPDIWPPNRALGTLEEMQRSLELCDKAGILYGLHDNYIDFYPDADAYSKDILSFEANGQPRKAWFNEGIQARSYQFRPDRFLPFLERNFDMMVPHLPQSCYFVDVFSSIAPPDFYDHEGNFHSRAETLEHWGRGFDIIRDRLTTLSRYSGPDRRDEFHAPTISESGDDFLIGHLDGADCQFGRLDVKPNDFVSVVPCEDWERVPWFDAVNHTTFSLHGAGYSNRYEGGTGRLLHGIESDDYICTEVLTGHPSMVDRWSSKRGAVRKYWLLQSLARELADCEIVKVEFADGDIHRQIVHWAASDESVARGGTVYVNRSRTDWTVEFPLHIDDREQIVKNVLPPFGFIAFGSWGICGITRSESGDVSEFSWGDHGQYLNGRQRTADGMLPLRVAVKPDTFRYLGENRFQCDLLWTPLSGKSEAPQDYAIFVHLVPADWEPGGQSDGIVSVFGCQKPKPVPDWNGATVTPMNTSSIPADGADRYRLLVGLYNAGGDGHRALLLDQDFENRRYSVGLIDVKRDSEGKITELNFETEPALQGFEAELRQRLAPPKEALSSGPLKTKGAFLLHEVDGKTALTPLPGEPATEVVWTIGVISSARIVAVDAEGKKVYDVPATFRTENHVLTATFTTRKDDFRYVLEIDE